MTDEPTWDPAQYAAFAAERGRPFADLVARIDAAPARLVVDLGCGRGDLTATLATRWPGAEVVGVDSSPEMIEDAQALAAPPTVRFELGDLRTWQPAGPVDVLVSNAALQWVPDHLALLARFASWLAPHGRLAFQVPAQAEAPSHRALAELRGAERLVAHDLAVYAATLGELGFRVDAWETIYLHLLTGADPVLEWMKGTSLRPVLAELDGPAGADFLAALRDRLRAAYPPRPDGVTAYPFRRRFVVAHRP